MLSLTAMLEADNGIVPLELLARIDLLVPTLPQAVQPEMRALGMVAMWRQDDDR